MSGRRLPCRDGRSRRGRGRCGRGRATRLVGAAAPRRRTVRHLSPSTPRQRAQPVLRRRSGSQGTRHAVGPRRRPPSPARRRCDQRSLSPVRTRSVVPRPPWVNLGWGILPPTPCAWSPATPIQSPHMCRPTRRCAARWAVNRSDLSGQLRLGAEATPIDGLGAACCRGSSGAWDTGGGRRRAGRHGVRVLGGIADCGAADQTLTGSCSGPTQRRRTLAVPARSEHAVPDHLGRPGTARPRGRRPADLVHLVGTLAASSPRRSRRSTRR